jgi:hypothetical protein
MKIKPWGNSGRTFCRVQNMVGHNRMCEIFWPLRFVTIEEVNQRI